MHVIEKKYGLFYLIGNNVHFIVWLLIWCIWLMICANRAKQYCKWTNGTRPRSPKEHLQSQNVEILNADLIFIYFLVMWDTIRYLSMLLHMSRMTSVWPGGLLNLCSITNCSLLTNHTGLSVTLLHSLSGKYPWERYEPPYPPSYGLNSTTTVLEGEWLWH